MGLLDTIKSVLGLSSDDESTGGDGTDVSVEYEPATESEAAVKGVDDEETAASGSDATASTGSMTEEPPEEGVEGAAEPAEAAGPPSQTEEPTTEAADEAQGTTEGTGDDEETAASGSDATASTGSMTEEPPEEGVEGAAEPAEAAGPQTGDVDTESTDEPEGEDEEAVTNEGDETDDRPVDTLDGIGPAYAERLSDAGIETAGDLTDADPLTVAEESDISEKRIERWMETARETR